MLISSRELSDFSDKDLSDMFNLLSEEMTRRAVSIGDPNVILNEFIQGDKANRPYSPVPGLVVVPSTKTEITARKHKCNQATIRIGNDDWWSWDEMNPAFIHQDIVKVGGTSKRGVLLSAIEDMIIVQNDMTYDEADNKHIRKSYATYIVKNICNEKTGEITETSVIKRSDIQATRLPVPQGAKDLRSY